MQLAANILHRLARYKGWVLLAVVAIVVFAFTKVFMVSLLGPLFEILPAEMSAAVPLVSAVTGAQPQTTDTAAEALSLSPSGLESVNPYVQLRRLYEGMRSLWGVSEDNLIFFIPVLLLVVYLLQMLSSFFSSYAFQHAGLGVTTDLRNDLCKHILGQSNRFYQQHTSGELLSRVVSDVDKMQNAVSSRLLDLFQQSLALAGLVWMLLSIHPKLAIVCLLAAPLIVYPIVRFGKRMFSSSHHSQERMADLSGLLNEMVRGHRIVKAFGMEGFELRRFREATSRHLRVNLRMQILSSYSSPVVESMAALGGCVLLIYCGFLMRSGQIGIDVFLQFLICLFLIYDPVRKLNKVNLVVQGAMAAAARVFELLAIPSEIEDPIEPRPLQEVGSGVLFDNVSFRYHDAYVLQDFTLSIRCGQKVALVGHSGAGKSTVANLLPRFFDPVEGSVRIDGIDIRQVSLADLRGLIGLVSQETILFNDTVRNNLAYGREEMPIERVREAAAASYADEFIMHLADGYETVIGEGGQNLSGGERQRLSIARALLKDAPILILDEATSQLDTESEIKVQKALDNLMRGRTTLVIAHRLSTVKSADVIVVMEAGRIVEQGSHQELLEMGGAYRRLYELQFKI